MTETTVFDVVGGQPFFDRLVERFYVGVEQDVALRAMYPTDLAPAQRRLALFLGQYWGGPTTYSDERGHPRLRMRHVDFPIDDGAREAWLAAMLPALAETAAEAAVDPEITQRMYDYFLMAAQHMLNRA